MGLVITGLLIFLVFNFGAAFPIMKIVLFFLSLLLALILNFTFFFIISISAFWLLEIGFLFEAVRIVIIFLSGGIFPLDIFGEKVAWLSSFLPFQYTINFPVEILNGKLTISMGLKGIIMQAIWILLFGAVAKLLWSVGTRHYVAVGG
jgi:ABC-2 type transport system permease protein